MAHLHETIVEVADGLVQAADPSPAAARLHLRKSVGVLGFGTLDL
jgi:hypothetical protein